MLENTCDRCQCRDCDGKSCEHPCKWVSMACMSPVTECNDFKEKIDG